MSFRDSLEWDVKRLTVRTERARQKLAQAERLHQSLPQPGGPVRGKRNRSDESAR